jgi:hypothetical protein
MLILEAFLTDECMKTQKSIFSSIIKIHESLKIDISILFLFPAPKAEIT